jgi:SAM-dependent methyltransferase
MNGAQRLNDTRDAFDSVAADYDGPRGNNFLIQEMRAQMWRSLDALFTPPCRLLDLGCGTGLDAVRMAQRGHAITATDWSPRMVQRTIERAAAQNVTEHVTGANIGAHELEKLTDSACYDGAYSNLGPLNCVPSLADTARECARLLKPGGVLVFSVIGRICPWEIAHYARKGRWARVAVRFSRSIVPVGMNQHIVWSNYFTPSQFYRAFQPWFGLEGYRGLALFAPPPYLTWLRDRHPRWHERLWRIDQRVAGWPLLRAMGDHFLICMKKR